jgi:hypothetical protein
MPSLRAKARTRIPSIAHFVGRLCADRRLALYDLLPLVSTPRARDRLARLIAWFRPKTPGFAPAAGARRLHEALVTEGITLRLPPLPAAEIAAMRHYFETVPCHDPYRPQLGRFRFDAPPDPATNMGFFTAAEILAAPHVLALLNDPMVLETAELFLGCKPLLDNISCWWSYGGKSSAKGTQRYHRDFDSLRGFKLFLYLSDVDAAGGPHVFMRGSQRSARLDTGSALPDAAIHEAFGIENEVAMTGPAGTRFLADTFGWHKGLLPGTGNRLMLVAQYNINRTPHLPAHPVMAMPAGAGWDPFVNRLILGEGGAARR